MKDKTVLLTGIAGFIGASTAERLIQEGTKVVGVDNFNDYYDVTLKRDRVKALAADCEIVECDVADFDALQSIFKSHKIDQVCHLAAQAGVRYSLTNPLAYENANGLGTMNLLELCRQHKTNSFIYASSSSVYGGNTKTPFSVEDRVDHPISIYAATKKYNELQAHAYHHLYGIRCTGLRFFTVYGPWGRPDMALFKFTKAILQNKPIDVYNHGKMKRDFTYISDIVDGIVSALKKDHAHEIFNLGNSHPEDLMVFIQCIEKALGKKSERNLLPLQPGDVPATWADIEASTKKLGYQPKVRIEEGIGLFIDWYRDYFKVN